MTIVASHHGVEFFIVDASIAIDVSLVNHTLDLLLGESLSKVAHHTGKLLPIDKTVSILVREVLTFIKFLTDEFYPVKHLESLADFILGILRLLLQGHHAEEFREVNHSSAILIHLVDHVLYLCL